MWFSGWKITVTYISIRQQQIQKHLLNCTVSCMEEFILQHFIILLASVCVEGILDISNSHHINDLPLTMVQNLLCMYLNRNYFWIPEKMPFVFDRCGISQFCHWLAIWASVSSLLNFWQNRKKLKNRLLIAFGLSALIFKTNFQSDFQPPSNLWLSFSKSLSKSFSEFLTSPLNTF